MFDTSVLKSNIIDSVNASKGTDLGLKMKRSADAKGFENHLERALEKQGAKKPVDRKLMDACIEMESLFVSKMLKEMRKTVPKNEWLHGGFAEDIFEDMLYDEYSKDISRNANLGLATMLYDEMSRK